MKTTPNTGMAVLMVQTVRLHPSSKKKLAGERLAFWALAKTYGMERMHYRSPEVKSLTVEGRGHHHDGYYRSGLTTAKRCSNSDRR